MCYLIFVAALFCGIPTSSFADEPQEAAQSPPDEKAQRAAALLRCKQLKRLTEFEYLHASIEHTSVVALRFDKMPDRNARVFFPVFVEGIRNQVAVVRRVPELGNSVNTSKIEAELERGFDGFDFELVAAELGRLNNRLSASRDLLAAEIKKQATEVDISELTLENCEIIIASE